MFKLFKRKPKLSEINYNDLLLNVIYIKTNTRSIIDFRDILKDIEKQIYNRVKRLEIRDVTISNVRNIETISWIINDDGYLFNDINSIVLDILKYSKEILIYSNKTKDKLSNNYNNRRLSPVIIEIKYFLKILNINIEDL